MNNIRYRTYDRGFMVTYGFDFGLDVVAEVVNGNGIGPTKERLFDLLEPVGMWHTRFLLYIAKNIDLHYPDAPGITRYYFNIKIIFT